MSHFINHMMKNEIEIGQTLENGKLVVGISDCKRYSSKTRTAQRIASNLKARLYAKVGLETPSIN